METVNQQNTAKIQNFWDNFADTYKKNEIGTLQTVTTCAVMSRAAQAKRILEVACGAGLHSTMLSATFLTREQGVLVSCDFSPNMVGLLDENYKQSDFIQVPGNKVFIDKETNYAEVAEDGVSSKQKMPLDQIIADQGDFKKCVIGCRANNEALPFPSEAFDSYISNLSLFIVDNPKNQVLEAFRVLKKGGAACFSLWGSKDKSVQFTVVETAIEKYLTKEQITEMNSGRSNFRLYADGGKAVISYLEEAGFKGIKIWPQVANFMYRTGEDYMASIGGGRLNKFCKQFNLDDETKAKIFADSVKLYDDWSGKNTTDLKTNECAIVVAFKD